MKNCFGFDNDCFLRYQLNNETGHVLESEPHGSYSILRLRAKSGKVLSEVKINASGGGGSDDAADIFLRDNVAVGEAVGGLTKDLDLTDKSVAEIIKILVGAVTPPGPIPPTPTGFSDVYYGMVPREGNITSTIDNLDTKGVCTYTFNGITDTTNFNKQDGYGNVTLRSGSANYSFVIITKDPLITITWNGWEVEFVASELVVDNTTLYVYMGNQSSGTYTYALVK